MKRLRTHAQIVEEANTLARQYYALLGHAVRAGYRFDRATHPQELAVWRMASIAMETLLGVDVENARAEDTDAP